jgi:hypothetical protein
MEPTGLNSSEDPDARLDELLRRPAPLLPDNGFSPRVMAALPAPTGRGRFYLRCLVCAAGAMIGVLFVLACTPSWSDLTSSFEPMDSSIGSLIGILTDPMLALVMVVTTGSLLYAFGIRKRRYS